MKKILSAVVLVAAVAAISMTSFAADEDAAALKKAERRAFKESVSQQLAQVKDARAALKAQRDENKALASGIKPLKEDKASETPAISKEARAQIKLLFEEIQGVRAGLKETKSDVQAARDAMKEAIQAFDQEGVTVSCEALADLLEGRLESREDMAGTLNEISALISE